MNVGTGDTRKKQGRAADEPDTPSERRRDEVDEGVGAGGAAGQPEGADEGPAWPGGGPKGENEQNA
jgi:hypothetical protein